MSRNCFSVMRQCKSRKITSFYMHKQFEKLRRMPKKRMESIFATEMCVLGDSKNHACPRARFCFLFPVKVNNC